MKSKIEINPDKSIIQSMLKLLETSINHDGEVEQFNPSLWPEIKRELKNNTVLPLVFEATMKQEIQEEEKHELANEMARNIFSFHKLMNAQTKALNLLSSNNIPAIVIKGTSAAQYYERPELRQYGDIDILVLPRDYEHVVDLLVSLGYKSIQVDNDDYKNRHAGFEVSNGVEVEIHQGFSFSSDDEQNELLNSWIYKSIESPKLINISRYQFPCLPTLENGLIILGHINYHLESGIGLRHIIDWMQYVRSELTDEFWNEKFKNSAEVLGLDYLAIVATKMCQKYLGLELKLTWCNDADDELVDELLAYIVRKGNFGRSLEQESIKTMSIAHNFTNPVKAFNYLVENGSNHMIEAGLKPIKAVAWAYQIGHLVNKTFEYKNKNNITKEIKSGVQEAELLKRLHVTKI